MDVLCGANYTMEAANSVGDDLVELKKGPWTAEEDSRLANFVNIHGERNWNTIARCAGLRRNGKSCRLRWLNYLRPDVRRGNITLQEQLLILQLHSLWGNRWSKIAQHLPGRTDNEIKNYWRTRVQKLAKQLNCDVNSQQFRDAMRHEWIPRLMERVKASSGEASSVGNYDGPASSPHTPTNDYASSSCTSTLYNHQVIPCQDFMPEILSGGSPESLDTNCYKSRGPENIGSKSCNYSWLDGGYNSLLEDCFLTDDGIGNTWFV